VYASFSAASSLLAQQCLVPLLVLRLQPLLSRTVELVMLPAFFVYSVSSAPLFVSSQRGLRPTDAPS
jgi:hypothetical protein